MVILTLVCDDVSKLCDLAMCRAVRCVTTTRRACALAVCCWVLVVGGGFGIAGAHSSRRLVRWHALPVPNGCRLCGRLLFDASGRTLVSHLASFVDARVGGDICRVALWGLRAPCRALSCHTRHNGAPARSWLPACSMWRTRVARSRVSSVGSSISPR